jgi:hypothetical protein
MPSWTLFTPNDSHQQYYAEQQRNRWPIACHARRAASTPMRMNTNHPFPEEWGHFVQEPGSSQWMFSV